MNQRIWSGLSATLLMTTLGTATAGQAQQASQLDPAPETSSSETQVRQVTATATPASKQPQVQPEDVVQLRDRRSPIAAAVEQAEVIAKIQAYESGGRKVAILYVRNIPVLTFWDSRPATSQRSQVGATATASTKTASRQSSSPHRAIRSDELEGAKQYTASSDR
ncbi:MAG TPA: hypothetical protein V6D26_06180, partial [Stenomitos sp.]